MQVYKEAFLFFDWHIISFVVLFFLVYYTHTLKFQENRFFQTWCIGEDNSSHEVISISSGTRAWSLVSPSPSQSASPAAVVMC